MPCLPHSTVLSKVNLFISVLALVLYCVGGLISQWITADFVLPMSPPVNVDVHMGLVESCKETSVMGNVISDDCSAKGGRYFLTLLLLLTTMERHPCEGCMQKVLLCESFRILLILGQADISVHRWPYN